MLTDSAAGPQGPTCEAELSPIGTWDGFNIALIN